MIGEGFWWLSMVVGDYDAVADAGDDDDDDDDDDVVSNG